MSQLQPKGAWKRMFNLKTMGILFGVLVSLAALAGPVHAEWESTFKPASEQAKAKALTAGEFIYAKGANVKCPSSAYEIKWEFQKYVVSVFPFNIEQPPATRGYDLKVKIGALASCTSEIGTSKLEAEAGPCVMRMEQASGEFKQLKGGYDTECNIKNSVCTINIPSATKITAPNSGLLSTEAENSGNNVITKTNFKGITANAKGVLCPLARETKTAEFNGFEQEGSEAHAS
jgi:hypothetical protein